MTLMLTQNWPSVLEIEKKQPDGRTDGPTDRMQLMRIRPMAR